MANGPRVFYVALRYPNVEGAERKISARSPKSAAEIFITGDYPKALWYKPGAVKVSVQEEGQDKIRTFEITTTVVAKEVKM